MSTAALPGSYPPGFSPAQTLLTASEPPPRARTGRPGKAGPLRRPATPAQGRALETLGHAVEYLVDSRMFQLEGHIQRDEQEAVQILMRLSRAVFAECPVVVPLRRKLAMWIFERITATGDSRPVR